MARRRPVRVDWAQRRVWICDRRWHHWLSGVLCMLAGAWLAYDDRADLPWRNHLA